MKKKGIIAFVLSFALFLQASSAFALDSHQQPLDATEFASSIQPVSVNIQFNTPSNLVGIGTIHIRQAININGVQNNLFCEFDNPDQAIEDLKENIPDLLSALQEQYALQALSSSNWKEYYSNLYQYEQSMIDAQTLTKQTAQELAVLYSFFDIYENTEQNEKILALIDLASDEDLQEFQTELAAALPYTSPFAVQTVSSQLLATTRASFNVTNANAYAAQWANDDNHAAYGSFGASADCTNFASQILEAGGKTQNYTGNTATGWWHKRISNTVHQYSNSWTVANKFGLYWGKSYQTKSFYNLSKNVTVGDFIAQDRTNDGSLDHIGYITTVGTEGNYGGQTYRDLKIAQHSTHYHAWVSSSINGWENMWQDYPNGYYWRIRV